MAGRRKKRDSGSVSGNIEGFGQVTELRLDLAPERHGRRVELRSLDNLFDLCGGVQRVLEVRIRFLGLLEMIVESLGLFLQRFREMLRVFFLRGFAKGAL